jgi:hypothetical protein
MLQLFRTRFASHFIAAWPLAFVALGIHVRACRDESFVKANSLFV